MRSFEQVLLKRACQPGDQHEQQTFLITVQLFFMVYACTVGREGITLAPTNTATSPQTQSPHRSSIGDDSHGAKVRVLLPMHPLTCRTSMMRRFHTSSKDHLTHQLRCPLADSEDARLGPCPAESSGPKGKAQCTLWEKRPDRPYGRDSGG
ncbi:hypothetical protein B0T11DRAFT_285017 [Plectosphaerella cucumerina]|uniref:Uncharacterized protein n=1 Tax=Plectosphaerella cucumerina TaxID=40658 RepID=A0A8K0THW5_9PEZI|nr:hypothetical protein B0T11DRAFT_285017 [Plectosphaerella cucumerina]